MLLSTWLVKFFFFRKKNSLLKIPGYTGLNCQYLSTCTINVTCLNGGVCNAAYDLVSRSSYFICNCAAGYVINMIYNCRRNREVVRVD
jgi:hypothetical protein